MANTGNRLSPVVGSLLQGSFRLLVARQLSDIYIAYLVLLTIRKDNAYSFRMFIRINMSK